jgi:hypothetical protein
VLLLMKSESSERFVMSAVEEKLTPAELEDRLRGFYGSEDKHAYSSLFRRHLLTDGAKYLAEKAGAYWLMDVIASHHRKVQTSAQIRAAAGNDRLLWLQIWRIKKTKGKSSCVVTCWEDTGKDERPVVRQCIEYTDFPFDLYELYVGRQVDFNDPENESKVKWVIMLKSEY